jgi:phage shock protein C
VDPVLVRLGFVLLALANGVGVLFYIISWVIMPTNEEQDVSEGMPPREKVVEEVRVAGEQVRAAGARVAAEVREQARDSGRGHMIGGAILVVVGLMFLLDRFSWVFHWPHWLRFGNLWPLILVAVGMAMLMRSREQRT